MPDKKEIHVTIDPPVSREKGISLLVPLLEEIDTLKGKCTEDPAVKKWHARTESTLERLFGDNSIQAFKFKHIIFSPMVYPTTDERCYKCFHEGLDSSKAIIEAIIEEVNSFWEGEKPIQDIPAIEIIKNTLSRFHSVARQLRSRHQNRDTLKVVDEYDVQDLLHALLRLHFEDIRAEEWTPSYAGGCSRMDFLIPEEKIVIEVKKTRKSMNAKELGDQLLIDIQRYEAHPSAKILICFTYDPEGIIPNPRGIERDLTKQSGELEVCCFIRPL